MVGEEGLDWTGLSTLITASNKVRIGRCIDALGIDADEKTLQ